MRIWPSKRTWKRLGLGLLILFALVFIANGFIAWWTEHRLHSKVAGIRAAGDPASIADLAPKPIPDAENAAAFLKRFEPRIHDFDKAEAEFSNSPLGQAYEKLDNRDEPATTEQMAAIRSMISQFADLNDGLETAAACSHYASTFDYRVEQREFMDRLLKSGPTRKFRSVIRFLSYRNKMLIVDGRQEQAVKNCLTMFRLIRHYDNEPLLINMLVACAVRGVASASLEDALSAGPIPPELHMVVDEELSLNDNPQRLAWALKSDRAYSIDAGTTLACSAMHIPKWFAGIVGWPITRYEIGVLDTLDVEISRCQRPDFDVRQLVQHQLSGSASSGNGILADLMLPAVQAAYSVYTRTIVEIRALRIDNALRAFAKKNGRQARGLDELSLAKDAMTDPYDGKPFKLKLMDQGWIVYSVMENGVDDGGKFADFKDFGVAPRKLRLAWPEDSSEGGTAAKTQ